jgi:hypothetical protein
VPDRRGARVCLERAARRCAACLLAAACAAPNPAFDPGLDVPDAASRDVRSPVTGGNPGSAGSPSVGGSPGTGGTFATTGGTAGQAQRRYDFESDVEDWHELRGGVATFVQSTTKALTGRGSLEMRVDIAGVEDRFAGRGHFPLLDIPAGTVLRFHIWLPSSAALRGVQPFLLWFGPDPNGGAIWEGRWYHGADLPRDRWIELTVTAPVNMGVVELGVQIQTSGPWRGSIWIDDVSW